jgi:hypothetical protein
LTPQQQQLLPTTNRKLDVGGHRPDSLAEVVLYTERGEKTKWQAALASSLKREGRGVTSLCGGYAAFAAAYPFLNVKGDGADLDSADDGSTGEAAVIDSGGGGGATMQYDTMYPSEILEGFAYLGNLQHVRAQSRFAWGEFFQSRLSVHASTLPTHVLCYTHHPDTRFHSARDAVVHHCKFHLAAPLLL